VRAFVAAGILVVAQLANAAPKDDEAARLKKQGDAAMLDLHYEDALEAYSASYKLSPNPALHYNRARAFEALGRYPEALSAYEAFAHDAPPDLRAKVPGLDGHIAGVRKRVSTLTLNVPVKGARVILRDVVVATTAAPLRLNAGKAKLEVTADGYQRYEKELDLPGGESLTVDVTLVPQAGDGTLVIGAEPAASLAIDGKSFGTTPVEAKLPSGSHTVTLSRSGYVTRTTTIVLASGERKQLSLSLEAEPGITSRWWFWTGVGAVVVGGTALTIGMLTSRDAGRGDIDPGRVSAPLVRF
jgi:hypothetical protein